MPRIFEDMLLISELVHLICFHLSCSRTDLSDVGIVIVIVIVIVIEKNLGVILREDAVADCAQHLRRRLHDADEANVEQCDLQLGPGIRRFAFISFMTCMP